MFFQNRFLPRIVSAVFAPLVFSQIASASSHECVSGSVVMRRKVGVQQPAELSAINHLLVQKDTSSNRSISGINTFSLNTAGKRVLCDDTPRPCSKLDRHARQLSFSTFRRERSYTCGLNYILYADSVKQSPKAVRILPLPNDALIKQQKSDLITNLKATTAWKITTGAPDVVVAVVDTGVDYTHEDLSPNIMTEIGRRFSDLTVSQDPMDGNGHGTHVSGTIGAIGNNGVGVAGISWHSKILPAAFLGSDGSGTIADAIKAIDYVITTTIDNGLNLRAINNSWGGGGFNQPLYDVISRANDAGILFVAAAGNEANDNDASPSYPAGYLLPNVISVAAIDTSDDTLAYFSNYGANTVDIAAPGVKIASTYLNNSYVYLSGTSMATPHVTGAIALLASAAPYLNAAQIKERLLSTGKYNPELSGSVRGALELNLGNLLKNNTTESVFRKIKK